MERSTFLPRHSSLARFYRFDETSSRTNESPPLQSTETRARRRSEIAIETRSIKVVRLRIRACRPSHPPRRTDDPTNRSSPSHARPRSTRHVPFAHFLQSSPRPRLRSRPLLFDFLARSGAYSWSVAAERGCGNASHDAEFLEHGEISPGWRSGERRTCSSEGRDGGVLYSHQGLSWVSPRSFWSLSPR